MMRILKTETGDSWWMQTGRKRRGAYLCAARGMLPQKAVKKKRAWSAHLNSNTGGSV